MGVNPPAHPGAGAGRPTLRVGRPEDELEVLETSIAGSSVAELIAIMARCSALRARASRILAAARIALNAAARG